MSEEELLKKYACNSLAIFIDQYLTCDVAYDLLRSQFKEIERLQHNQEVSTKWEIKLTQKNTKLIEENKRLHSIIKEVREYIENAIKTGNCTEDITYKNSIEKEHNYYVNSKELLEILRGDKE